MGGGIGSNPKSGKYHVRDWSLLLLFVSASLAALCAPITDCDEVYGYWEPLHFLRYGRGMQTWEYVPKFALRSWAFLAAPYAALTMIAQITSTKTMQFVLLRLVMACTGALCLQQLHCTIRTVFGKRCGRIFLMNTAFATAFFIALPSLLPQTFAMHCFALALSAQLQPALMTGKVSAQISPPRSMWRFDDSRFCRVILLTAIACIAGSWPFAGIAILPYLGLEIATNPPWRHIARWTRAALITIFGVLMPVVAIDSFFYGRFSPVFANIIRYNVFGGPNGNASSTLYGTEPWYYYLTNLALNFNIVLAFALLSGPIILLDRALHHKIHRNRNATTSPTASSVGANERAGRFLIIAPMIIYMLIFSLQPHKEERFLYPIYPHIIAASAIGIEALFRVTKRIMKRELLPKTLFFGTFLMFASISVLRNYALYTHYGAPLAVHGTFATYYAHLPASLKVLETNFCVADEFYRFPSHFFLPSSDLVLRFVKPEKNCCAIPHYFGQHSWENRPAELQYNDLNLPPSTPEAESRLFARPADCKFWAGSGLHKEMRPEDFEPLFCARILDKDKTASLLARTLGLDLQSGGKYLRRWSDYCIYRRRE